MDASEDIQALHDPTVRDALCEVMGTLGDADRAQTKLVFEISDIHGRKGDYRPLLSKLVLSLYEIENELDPRTIPALTNFDIALRRAKAAQNG